MYGCVWVSSQSQLHTAQPAAPTTSPVLSRAETQAIATARSAHTAACSLSPPQSVNPPSSPPADRPKLSSHTFMQSDADAGDDDNDSENSVSSDEDEVANESAESLEWVAPDESDDENSLSNAFCLDT